MATFLDLMALAKRTLERGEVELAGQMSVLALESLDDGQMFEENPDAEQNDADKDSLNEVGLLEALEEGDIDPNNTDGNMGKVGEIPTAMVLELATLAKLLKDKGCVKEAGRINDAIGLLSEVA